MIAPGGLMRRELMVGGQALEAQWFRCVATGVEVWCLPVEANGRLEGLELLSERERLRYARFRLAADREAYLAKRLLVRGALSEYAGVAPEDWRFVDDAYGRPGIEETCGVAGLRFSLARSGGLVVCGVSRQARVGVDVEDLLGGSGEPPVGVLSPAERERIGEVAQEERWAAFLRLWTLKEAYVKARGLGLSLPVAEASFDSERGRGIDIKLGAVLEDDAEGWRFGQVTVLERYVVATAVR